MSGARSSFSSSSCLRTSREEDGKSGADDGGSQTGRREGGPGTGEEVRDPLDPVMWGRWSFQGGDGTNLRDRERKLMREREQRGKGKRWGAVKA